MSEDYYEALKLCAERYDKMSENMEINEFVKEFSDCIDKRFPLCKLNRWLGYIQAVLIINNVSDVETERNWTRPLFRPLDFERK